jgi:phosphopantetheinyl transferase
MPLAKSREILYEPGGRPYFLDYHADFNISHSRNMVAAALQVRGRVGCDIQYLAPNKCFIEISRRFFHAAEQAYIEQDPAAQKQNFYRIWVLKEAWLKLHGLSVFDMAKAPAFSIGGNQSSMDKRGVDFFLYELSSPAGEESYMLAAARQRTSSSDGEAEPEIRWFSDAVLTLNKVENIYAAQSPENTVTPKI